jgi:hypothetical protein
MVYYLPASEHRMLKSPLPIRCNKLYRTASENGFPNFTDFLHGTE